MQRTRMLKKHPYSSLAEQVSLLYNTRHLATFRAAAEHEVSPWRKQSALFSFHHGCNDNYDENEC